MSIAKEFKTMREGLAALREEILAPGGPHVDRCRALLCDVMDALGEAENITIKREAKLVENPPPRLQLDRRDAESIRGGSLDGIGAVAAKREIAGFGNNDE